MRVPLKNATETKKDSLPEVIPNGKGHYFRRVLGQKGVKPVKLYRPGSGTEGIGFYERWCFKCAKDAEMNSGKPYDECAPNEVCSIIADTLAYEVDDPEYPKEWIYAADGRPACLAFEPTGKPYRCTETPDMFTGQKG